MITYLKISNEKENLNFDKFTTPDFIFDFLYVGYFLQEIIVPDNILVIEDNAQLHEFSATDIIVSLVQDLRDINTWNWLISNKINIHASDDYTLRFFSSKEHTEIIQFLIKHNANIHSCNDEALQIACINNKLENVKILINAGANTNRINTYTKRLMINNKCFEVINFLLEKGYCKL